ncbi:gamma-glutamylcyclotransferase family protein [Singulisphaera sp. PoT]|uniref:gamma-glutamylcyclotransferase family protein n=1 Tax=Singulisphaera sp. PoT TaxID=3411797 RepID=UPI003BF59DB1
MPTSLFTYGTLMPADPAAAIAGGWVADAVRGRLYNFGPYPGLVDVDDPDASWVDGMTCSTISDDLLRRLDLYEGVDEGLYERLAVTTRSGRSAWVYVYVRPLPQGAQGPLTRWEGPRIGLGPISSPE